MKRFYISESSAEHSRKELALIAFHEAGGTDNAAFQKFWETYQELLVQKLGYEAYYLSDVLEEQCKQRHKDRTNKLISAIQIAFGFVLGIVFLFLIRL